MKVVLPRWKILIDFEFQVSFELVKKRDEFVKRESVEFLESFEFSYTQAWKTAFFPLSFLLAVWESKT